MPRRRLQIARDYMIWVAQYHKKMLADWEDYKRAQSQDPEEQP